MQIAMVGLGRMGANMAERLMRGGHSVVGYDPAEAARSALEQKGAQPAASLEQMVGKLKAPRVVWLMVPAGEITDGTVAALMPLLAAGDTIIDGGNSNYRDTQRRAAAVAQRQLHYVPALQRQLRQSSGGNHVRHRVVVVPSKIAVRRKCVVQLAIFELTIEPSEE